MSFVHLHCHSEYSLLDGANRIGDLINRALELEQPALAVTDHGNLHAAWEFQDRARKAGLKPIIGMEAYVAPGDRRQRGRTGPEVKPYFHLVLLAANRTGYRNLVKLTSLGYTEGFYSRPRIDRELLEQYGEGLIVSSACMAGELASHQREMLFNVRPGDQYPEVIRDLHVLKSEHPVQHHVAHLFAIVRGFMVIVVVRGDRVQTAEIVVFRDLRQILLEPQHQLRIGIAVGRLVDGVYEEDQSKIVLLRELEEFAYVVQCTRNIVSFIVKGQVKFRVLPVLCRVPLDLVVAVAYGGRWDLAQAARQLAGEAATGKLEPQDLDEAMLAGRLMTAGRPEPDLFIRTGGERRISNFLLWDLAYTELWFTDTLWPDFDEAAYEAALQDFAGRQRRFGRITAQLQGN